MHTIFWTSDLLNIGPSDHRGFRTSNLLNIGPSEHGAAPFRAHFRTNEASNQQTLILSNLRTIEMVPFKLITNEPAGGGGMLWCSKDKIGYIVSILLYRSYNIPPQ